MSIRNKLLQDILSAIGGGGSVIWGSITGTVANQTDLATVAATGDYDDLINKFDPTADIRIERLLNATSVAATQDPAGLGPINAAQVEFGPAQFGALDPVQIDALGNTTINEAGLYRVKVSLQAGRSGVGGTSELLIRALFDGVQQGRTVAIKLANENIISPFTDEAWLNLPAAAVVTYEIMRDSVGADSGGLVGQDVTVEAGSWNQDVCAELRIERLIGT